MNIPRASIWPNVVFDTTRPEGMAAAQAWATTVLGDTPGSSVERRNGATSTQGADETNRAILPPPERGTHESELRVIVAPTYDPTTYDPTNPDDDFDPVPYFKAARWSGGEA